MPNLSTSLIQFEVYENNQLLHSGTCHYDLLAQVWALTEDGTRWDIGQPARYLKFNIDGEWFTLNGIGSVENNSNESVEVYDALVMNRSMLLPMEQSKEAFRIAQEQEELNRAILESSELTRIAQESISRFNEMLIEQKQLTEDQAQLNYAEQLRQDENRIALVRGVALDPNTAVDALQSEFGWNGDIRRQVAAVMERDISISKRIVQLPTETWMSSYEIMAVVGAQSSEDHEFAQLVSDKLPDDSSLKTLLKSFGWAN